MACSRLRCDAHAYESSGQPPGSGANVVIETRLILGRVAQRTTCARRLGVEANTEQAGRTTVQAVVAAFGTLWEGASIDAFGKNDE
jgi:hypothetical protein